MPRPTEQQKLRVQNSWSPRAMVLLLQTKERETKVLEEVTVQAVGEGLRAKPTAPYKGSGSKSMFALLARKTETFKDSRRPGMPSKTSSSNVSSKSWKPRARGQGGEWLRFCSNFYSLTKYHSTYFILPIYQLRLDSPNKQTWCLRYTLWMNEWTNEWRTGYSEQLDSSWK